MNQRDRFLATLEMAIIQSFLKSTVKKICNTDSKDFSLYRVRILFSYEALSTDYFNNKLSNALA